jgi:hypothetical protein
LRKKALEAGNRENGKLQIGMGDEHDAEGDAQDEGAIGGETGVDHDCLHEEWFDRPNMIVSFLQINSRY